MAMPRHAGLGTAESVDRHWRQPLWCVCSRRAADAGPERSGDDDRCYRELQRSRQCSTPPDDMAVCSFTRHCHGYYVACCSALCRDHSKCYREWRSCKNAGAECTGRQADSRPGGSWRRRHGAQGGDRQNATEEHLAANCPHCLTCRFGARARR
jgi:hypothetical protein